MYIVATTDPVAAIRAEVRRQRARALPVRLWRLLADAWLRRPERRIERAVRRLGHDGVLDDFRQASRG